MNSRSSLFLVALALVLAVGTCWAGELSSMSTVSSAPQAQQAPPQELTASGKVTAVQQGSFSVEVQQGPDRKTLNFVTNQDTRIQGELKAGASARVTYRVEGGRNIATEVTVM